MFSPRNAVLVAGFPFAMFFIAWICEGEPETQLILSVALMSLYGIVALVDQFNWWRRSKPSKVYVYLVLEDTSSAFPTEFAKSIHRSRSLKEGHRERHKSGFWLSRKRRKGKEVWRSL